jgi:hypothetical protein
LLYHQALKYEFIKGNKAICYSYLRIFHSWYIKCEKEMWLIGKQNDNLKLNFKKGEKQLNNDR